MLAGAYACGCTCVFKRECQKTFGVFLVTLTLFFFLKQKSPRLEPTYLTAPATRLLGSAHPLPTQLRVLGIQTQALLLSDPSLWKPHFSIISSALVLKTRARQNKQQIKSLFVYVICLCQQEPRNLLTPSGRKQNTAES